MSEVVYFVYKDDEDTPYFYNSETQEVTYEMPDEGIFLNPEDSTPYVFENIGKLEQAVETATPEPEKQDAEPEAAEPSEPERKRTRLGDSNKKTTFEEYIASQNEIETPAPKKKAKKVHTRRTPLAKNTSSPIFSSEPTQSGKPDISTKRFFLPGEGDYTPMLPFQYTANQLSYRIVCYARKYFKPQSVGNVFNRREIPVEQLIKYSVEPLTALLHKDLDESLEKSGLKIYNSLLQYANGPSPKPELLVDIAEVLHNTPGLIDEAFMYVVKQTTDCPQGESQRRYWDAFIFLATIFPASKRAYLYIIDHLSGMSRSPVEIVSKRAQFCYIRFSARTARQSELDIEVRGPNGKKLDTKKLEELAVDVSRERMKKRLFGVSLYEMLWHQQDEHPLILFPYVLHQMCERMLALGAETTQGVFREVGRMNTVNKKSEEMYDGVVDFDGMWINDVGSLLKSWIRGLVEPIVPFDRIDDIRAAAVTGDVMQFANGLPPAHADTFCYLCGFMQRIEAAESVTKMTSENLAICFTPNLVQLPGDSSADENEIQTVSRDVIASIIHGWNTSAIYPYRD